MPVIKGGVKQRLGLGKSNGQPAQRPLRSDPLAECLMSMVSEGRLTAGEVGNVATAATSSASSSQAVAPHADTTAQGTASEALQSQGQTQGQGHCQEHGLSWH